MSPTGILPTVLCQREGLPAGIAERSAPACVPEGKKGQTLTWNHNGVCAPTGLGRKLGLASRSQSRR